MATGNLFNTNKYIWIGTVNQLAFSSFKRDFGYSLIVNNQYNEKLLYL